MLWHNSKGHLLEKVWLHNTRLLHSVYVNFWTFCKKFRFMHSRKVKAYHVRLLFAAFWQYLQNTLFGMDDLKLILKLGVILNSFLTINWTLNTLKCNSWRKAPVPEDELFLFLASASVEQLIMTEWCEVCWSPFTHSSWKLKVCLCEVSVWFHSSWVSQQ